MRAGTQMKRYVYLIHRWMGVGGCVLMVLWFISGMVMLFIGYPKLTPWERLAPLPALEATACCRPIDSLSADWPIGQPPSDNQSIGHPSPDGRPAGHQPADSLPGGISPADVRLVLTSIGGQPRYVWEDGEERLQVRVATDGVDSLSSHRRETTASNAGTTAGTTTSTAASTSPASTRTSAPATTPASTPTSTPAIAPKEALAEAHVFAPGASLHYAGTLDEDRWTHSRSLNPHRPLHVVELEGDEPGRLYISSATGQVVLDAPRYQQRWNYAGAWLHWLYMFRNQPKDPVWSWVVIVLSTACTVVAVTGVFVGIWRWRFRGRYRTGSHSPYREGWMRWHHITGLAFSLFVCTWIFSGLMSMSPYGLFPPAQKEPDEAAYRGKAEPMADTLKQPARIIETLQQTDFRPVELQWHRLGGETYVLALDGQARTRLVRAAPDGQPAVQDRWKPDDVMPAARHLFAEPATGSEVLGQYDAYYYQRHPEAMNGAEVHGLPALRIDYGDAEKTRVYIDLRTGQMADSMNAAQRNRRWLFYFLHSWDVPAILRTGSGRDAVLILLSAGGLAVSVTGVVIGWRRVKVKVARG